MRCTTDAAIRRSLSTKRRRAVSPRRGPGPSTSSGTCAREVAEPVEATGASAGPGPFDKLRDLCSARWLSLSKPPGHRGSGPFDKLRDLCRQVAEPVEATGATRVPGPSTSSGTCARQVAEPVEATGHRGSRALRQAQGPVRSHRQAQGPVRARWLSLSKPPGPGPFDKLRDLCSARWLSLSKPPGHRGPVPSTSAWWLSLSKPPGPQRVPGPSTSSGTCARQVAEPVFELTCG